LLLRNIKKGASYANSCKAREDLVGALSDKIARNGNFEK
jgi:hypothetical protein